MQAHFRHINSKIFPMIYGNLQSNGFWPLQFLFKNLEVHRDSHSQSGSSLGSVKFHSLTLSYIHGSMRCDSWASFLARTLVSPYFGHEPKAKVATNSVVLNIIILKVKFLYIKLHELHLQKGIFVMVENFGIESKSKKGFEKGDMHIVITIKSITIVSIILSF